MVRQTAAGRGGQDIFVLDIQAAYKARNAESDNSAASGAGTSYHKYHVYFNSTGVDGVNYVTWEIPMTAGTWRFEIMDGDNQSGDLELFLDGVSQGTINVSAGSGVGEFKQITGMVVTQPGRHEVKLAWKASPGPTVFNFAVLMRTGA